MRREFDRYMIAIRAGRHPKFTHLTLEERYAFFLGVLSLAAQSPSRGCLLAGNLPVTPAHVAAECGVSDEAAVGALEKLRAVGILEPDEEGRDWVRDFTDYNPAPKADVTHAERQRRYRQRHAASRDTVTRTVTRDGAGRHGDAGEVEVEVEEEEKPLTGGAPAPALTREAAPGDNGATKAATIPCPACGAPPGQACRAVRGGTRKSFHLERHHQAGELLAVHHPNTRRRTTPPGEPPATQQQRDADRAQQQRHRELCAHFPGIPAAVVLNAARQLSENGEPATIDQIRAHLTDPL